MKTLLLALLGAASLLQLTFSLRIGAFNIRALGDKKVSNQTISSFIARILTAYDLVLIQEVRDVDLSAVKKLMQQVNGASPDPFGYLISNPLGHSSYKEQYLFIYRQGRVSPVKSYYYQDGCEPYGNNTFSREPFIVKFAVPQSVVKELVLVPLHAAPEAAVTEIDCLYDVYQDVKDRWGATVSNPLGGSRAPPFLIQHKGGNLWAGGTVAIPPEPGRHILLFPLAGCPPPGRLQCRLQVRPGGGLALHPPALQQGLPVAHPRHGRYHGDQHHLCLRQVGGSRAVLCGAEGEGTSHAGSCCLQYSPASHGWD
uniref:Deoxyribonuclease 1 like 2 n=1 Tax=Laticauda laticaudata TaxID=8630 RepID=A0A8C5S672_LATLA